MKMKYRLAEACNYEDVAKQINELMSDGWVPQGGVAVLYRENYPDFSAHLYTQAMILILEDVPQ